MRAQQLGRLGRVDRRSWLGRARDALDALVKSSPSRFAILIFASLIVLFTVLFSLPIATATGQIAPLHDAVFTAVSVICVTGLATVDMATYWSPFGNALVFIGVNIGGVGVLTLASILGLVISRRLGLRAKLIAASDTNPSRIHVGPVSERQAVRLGEVGGLLATVAISALVIEVTIAIAMIPSMLAAGYDGCESIWYSFYYSAMAFTNTGFSPNPGGLTPLRARLLDAVAAHARRVPRQPRVSRSSSRWRARGGIRSAGACT